MKQLILQTAFSLACASTLIANAQGAAAVTPIAQAASAGHYETVRRLLSAGAQKNLKDKDGKTALDLAAEHRHIDLVALMREAS